MSVHEDVVSSGLYLHIPFCKSVCPYCDFAVRTGGAALRREFVDSLRSEIEMRRGYEAVFDTIYLGGGTPSVVESEQLTQILECVGTSLDVDHRVEIFLEANPEDVTSENLISWRELGVTSLSLGVQSFSERALRFLGRNHTPQQARTAVELAMKSGFATVSVDLIYGLPDQTVESWEHDLQAAVELDPDHLSCYQLTIHRETVFGARRSRGLLTELVDEVQSELFEKTHQYLKFQGYPAYEVSSFAKSPEHQSRHNLKYWDHTPYLGLGPSAHSFAGRRRWWNVRSLESYLQRVAQGNLPIDAGEDLTPEDLRFEAVMLGLRTSQGIDLEAFRSRWGLDLEGLNADLVEELVEQGRLSVRGQRLIPSPSGMAIADRLALRFDIGAASDS